MQQGGGAWQHAGRRRLRGASLSHTSEPSLTQLKQDKALTALLWWTDLVHGPGSYAADAAPWADDACLSAAQTFAARYYEPVIVVHAVAAAAVSGAASASTNGSISCHINAMALPRDDLIPASDVLDLYPGCFPETGVSGMRPLVLEVQHTT